MSTLLTMTMAKAEGKRKAKNRLIVQSKFPLHTLKNKTRVEVAIPLSAFCIWFIGIEKLRYQSDITTPKVDH